MTPELKSACEFIFQEHKLSAQPIRWGREAFRGKISIGLCEMAKETLVQKHIILLPGKPKKLFTQLNPDVATAGSFEEAEKIIETKVPNGVTNSGYDPETYITNHVFGFDAAPVQRKVQNERRSKIATGDVRWYMKPFYLYFAWPVCGAAAGLLIARLMDVLYTLFFLTPK